MAKTAPKGPPKSAKRKPAAAAPAPAPSRSGGPIKVEAIALGFHDNKRRRVGDVFTLDNPKHFSDKWMKRVDAKRPERTTTSRQAMAKKNAEIAGHDTGGTTDEDLIG